MKTKFYSDIEDLCLDVAEKYKKVLKKDKYGCITIITFYNKAKEILKELIFHGFDLVFIQLEDYEWANYDDEFCISIDFEGHIWCEKIKRDGKYLDSSQTVAYIDADANSKILSHLCDTEEIITFEIGAENEYEDGDVSAICECDGNCDCKDCEYSDGVDDEIEISDLKVLTFSGSHDGKYTSYCITSNNEDNLNKFRKLVQELDI